MLPAQSLNRQSSMYTFRRAVVPLAEEPVLKSASIQLSYPLMMQFRMMQSPDTRFVPPYHHTWFAPEASNMQSSNTMLLAAPVKPMPWLMSSGKSPCPDPAGVTK